MASDPDSTLSPVSGLLVVTSLSPHPDTSDGKPAETLSGVADDHAPALPIAAGRCSPLDLNTIHRLAAASAEQERIPAGLIVGVIFWESRFSPCAVSTSGALGLMQLLPSTAQDVGVKNPFDPEDSVRGGTRYLRFLLDRYHGDVELALAAYKEGLGVVDRYGDLPPWTKTHEYVNGILEIAETYATD